MKILIAGIIKHMKHNTCMFYKYYLQISHLNIQDTLKIQIVRLYYR